MGTIIKYSGDYTRSFRRFTRPGFIRLVIRSRAQTRRHFYVIFRSVLIRAALGYCRRSFGVRYGFQVYIRESRTYKTLFDVFLTSAGVRVHTKLMCGERVNQTEEDDRRANKNSRRASVNICSRLRYCHELFCFGNKQNGQGSRLSKR